MWHTLRASSQAEDLTEPIRDLSKSTSHRILLVVGIVIILALSASAVWPEELAVKTWAIAPLALVTYLLVLRLLPRHFLLAHIVWQTGITGILAASVTVFQVPEIAFLAILLPLTAVVTVGWPLGVFSQLLVTGIAWGLYHGLTAVPPPPTYGWLIGLGGAISGLLGWAAIESLLTVTQWSLFSYRQARDNVEEARNQRLEFKQIEERRVYLWPTGDTPGDEITVPCLRELLRVEGTIDQSSPEDTPVRGLVFRGLTFTRGDRERWTDQDAGLQHDWEMHDRDNALVRLRGAERCRIESCRFASSGGAAVRLDLHSQHNEVIGNRIEHIGGTGILLSGYGAGTKDVNKHNTIANNHIHHCGEILWHAIGIFVWQSGENHITHNLIHHTGYDAIVLSGTRPNLFKTVWGPDRSRPRDDDRPMFTGDPAANPRESGTIRREEAGSVEMWHERLNELNLRTAEGFTAYMEFVRPFFHTRGNHVEDNEIHHVMMRLGDGNAIYLSDVGRDNVIHHNYIHDLTGHGGQSAIRTDAFMTDTWITENVIVRCNCGGLNLKYYNNHALNNVMMDIPDIQDVDIHGNPVTLSFGYISIGDVFPKEAMPDGASVHIHRNIVYKTDARRPFYREYRRGDEWIELGVENCETDWNLYYAPEAADEGTHYLERYRTLGIDRHSIVGGPCFKDPEAGDFSFCPESPARRLAIKPIDLSSVGLTDTLPHYEAPRTS